MPRLAKRGLAIIAALLFAVPAAALTATPVYAGTQLIGTLLNTADLATGGSDPTGHDTQGGPSTQGPNDCWTTFAPSNPGGGAMNHYYMNCSAQTFWVMPVFYIDGYTFTYSAMCSKAPQNRKIEWFYPSTHLANYSTEVCDPYRPLNGRILTPPPSAWN